MPLQDRDPKLPSNSYKSRAGKTDVPAGETKNITRVVQGEVTRRKKPLGKRFTETFFGGGDARTVWGYVAFDVLLPAAKDMIADAVSTGVERMIFGDAARSTRSRGRGRGSGSYTDYRGFGSSGTARESHDRGRQQMSRRARATHDFDEIILPSRAEAEEVLDVLLESISKYQMATVADLYEMVGIEPSYTDDKWGWRELPGAGVSRLRSGGFLLDLPRPEPID